MGAPADFAYILDDAAIDIVIVDPDREADIVKAIAQSGEIRVLTLGGGRTNDLFRLAAQESASRIELREIDPEAIVRIVYTGRTTGVPKATLASYRAMSTMFGIQLADWQWPEDVRHLLVAPLSHVGATCFTPTIVRGGTLYVEKGFDPGRVLTAIETHRITCILMVPTMISALLDHPQLKDHDTTSIETIFYGASPITPARLRAAIGHPGPVFFQFYGRAEAMTTVTTMRREDHDLSSDQEAVFLRSSGRRCGGRSCSIPDGNEAPDGEPGELCVRGPLLMSGYLGKPAETAGERCAAALAPHRRCRVVRDPDGFLLLVDRAKDSGDHRRLQRLSPRGRGCPQAHPGVASAKRFQCARRPLGRDRRCSGSCFASRTPALPTSRPMCANARAVQTPKRFEIVDSIPLTAVGNARRRKRCAACSRPPRRKSEYGKGQKSVTDSIRPQGFPDPIRDHLTRLMADRGIPGLQLAVVRDGAIAVLGALGVANVEHQVPVTSESIFSINSMAKAFTGIAVMQLVEDGLLDLSAPLATYLDDLPAHWQAITVRQLATLTAGVPEIMIYTAESNVALIGDGTEEGSVAGGLCRADGISDRRGLQLQPDQLRSAWQDRRAVERHAIHQFR